MVNGDRNRAFSHPRKLLSMIVFFSSVVFLSLRCMIGTADGIDTSLRETTIRKVTAGITLPLPPATELTKTYELAYEDFMITLKHYSKPGREFGTLMIAGKNDPRYIYYYEQGIPPPVTDNPLKVFKGPAANGPSRYRVPPLLCVLTRMEDDINAAKLLAYQLDSLEPQNHASLRLGGTYTYELSQIVRDFDDDGNIEVINLELKVAGTREDMPESADLGVRSIYRFVYGGGVGGQYASSPTPHFERVKGRAFEKYFVMHANKLINDAYPKLLALKDIQYAEIVVLNWLATVESTHNSELISAALARLETLPYPDKYRKRALIRMLILDGYPLLKQQDSELSITK